jgi:hypothetical protein
VDEAVFITDSRFRPQMRFQVENLDGVFDFKLRLDRGLARVQPASARWMRRAGSSSPS